MAESLPRLAVPSHAHLRGFTIWEALIVVLVIAMLLSIALPILRKSRNDAMTQQSMFNLMMLSASHFMYSADHNGNQWTVTPHNLAEFGFSLNEAIHNYNKSVGGPANGIQICSNGSACFEVGWGCSVTGQCTTWYWGGAGVNEHVMPMSFVSPQAGQYRMPNLKSFHIYVGGKFYDSTFYAPKDVLLAEVIGDCLDAPVEFCGETTPFIVRSSYALSAASLFDPFIWTQPDGMFPPNSLMFQIPALFKTPTFAQIVHPDLKTHLLELHWLQNNRKGLCHPDGQVPPGAPCPQYLFTHSIQSAPATLFYDGHVRLLPNIEVQTHEKRVELWRRDTPMGPAGYMLNLAPADDIVDVSHHILTKDGALGRDTLGPLSP